MGEKDPPTGPFPAIAAANAPPASNPLILWGYFESLAVKNRPVAGRTAAAKSDFRFIVPGYNMLRRGRALTLGLGAAFS
jgi:hypothetical protein